MHIQVLTIFAALAIVRATVAEVECGEDEIYDKCGTACPKTCDDYEENIACITVCRSGCFCKKGLVRSENGKCIPPEECPKEVECGEDEIYDECGTACPKTCDNYEAMIKCISECRSGCFCKKGLVRSENGKCIPPEKCPKKECPPNEVNSTCVNPCNDCEIRGKCNFLVCNKGCDCRPGFYRNNGVCIPENECPEKCGRREQYQGCGTSCELTCAKPKPGICNMLCVKGCFCKSPYVREYVEGENKGPCIPLSQCP